MSDRSRRRLSALLAAAATCAAPAAAQAPGDTVTVVAGERYAAGALHRFFLGSDYRTLWTTPLRVPVLDLSAYAGGLTPTRTGGGFQTRSLRFVAGDGTEYAFRSVDKDPSSILPEALRETLVDDLIQDQISSAHPVGALVAAPLLEAAGVLHAEPQLFVMPDDPRLGEFRAEFAGMLGLMELRPEEGEDGLPGFKGATNLVGTDRLLERIEEDVEHIDGPAFLSARLLDTFLGDWDRHRDQWNWARFAETRDSAWHPIPRDRDQAFVRLDGFFLAIARQQFPQLVRFDPSYSSTLGLTWNGRELDRRLLVGLEWPVWDSVAHALQSRLTDDVIERAVAALPPEYARLNAATLRAALMARRDALPDFARRFYLLLADVVEVHTTDADEVAEVTRLPGGALHVVVRATSVEETPVTIFERTFSASETSEVRLDLHGGADSARVTGPRSGAITIRVLGGGGDDVLIDESGGAKFYDTSGDNEYVRGPGTSVDERRYEYRGPAYTPSQPPRDWGVEYRYPAFAGYAPDVGVLLGLSVERYTYGFRAWPYRSRVRLHGAFGTSALAFRGSLDAEVYRRNSGVHWTLSAHGSGLEVLRFFGFGNETADDGSDDQYRVEQSAFSIDTRIVVPLGGRSVFSVGPEARLTATADNTGRLISTLRPYGWGTFAQAGLRADLNVDGRDRPRAATRGVGLRFGAVVHPAMLDLESAYTSLDGDATAYVTAPIPLRPTLALRAGGRKIWGDYPFADAAFIGDDSTVRLGVKQRYAGDAEAHANAELRLDLGRAKLVLPADVGVFGLVDTGRVWLEGEESGRWHRSAGGGISIAFLEPANTFSVAVTRGEGRTGVYVGSGFAF